MEESSIRKPGIGRYKRFLSLDRQYASEPALILKTLFSRVVINFLHPTDRGNTPMLEKFERYPLTFGPTHIEKLERLSAHLGGKVELYAKREDCNSGLAFGGNKLRKLEYIIP